MFKPIAPDKTLAPGQEGKEKTVENIQNQNKTNHTMLKATFRYLQPPDKKE